MPEASGKEADNTSAPEEGTKPDRDSDWNEFLGIYAGRKVVVYHITISFLLRDRNKSIDKISRSIETFVNAGEKICAIIVPQKQILTDLERIDMDLWEKYLDLTDIIRKSQNCIYDEGGFSLDFMEKWNGYYGDADPLVRKCVLKNIPVMIENIDV